MVWASCLLRGGRFRLGLDYVRLERVDEFTTQPEPVLCVRVRVVAFGERY